MPSPFLPLHSRASALMGIVNITPDSFSDGCQFLEPHAAIDHALQLAADGAVILDLGAEASSFFRPGISPVEPAEQLRRLLPVLSGLTRQLPAHPPVLLSIDTRSAQVAQAALEAGAHIINDISAGTHDPELLPTVARYQAGIILMHITPGYPATPAGDDPDILATVRTFLHARLAAAQNAGIHPDHIALDPGLGFGKTMPDNWQLALHASELLPSAAPHPLVLGASRKRFLETPPPSAISVRWNSLHSQITPRAANLPDLHPRDSASATLAALLTQNWPKTSPPLIHRVHHVTLTRSALTI